MKASRLFASAAAAALAFGMGSAKAEEFPGEFSANVAMTTDYVFRGISQTDDLPAIQGGFDWAHDSGFYVGTWASNVNFGDGDQTSQEIDVYAGYSMEEGPVSFDIGVIYYGYPGQSNGSNYDFVEVYLGSGYDFGVAAASISVAYSPEYFGESGDAIYSEFDLSIPFNEGYILEGIDGSVGQQTIDDEVAFGTPDYLTWDIGVTTSWNGFDFDLRYIDTDMDENECSDICDERVVFTVGRSF